MLRISTVVVILLFSVKCPSFLSFRILLMLVEVSRVCISSKSYIRDRSFAFNFVGFLYEKRYCCGESEKAILLCPVSVTLAHPAQGLILFMITRQNGSCPGPQHEGGIPFRPRHSTARAQSSRFKIYGALAARSPTMDSDTKCSCPPNACTPPVDRV